MKTKNRLVPTLLIWAVVMIFVINNISAQNQAGQGNFNIPEINATTPC
ncbi:MAG: hypothetical protein KA536_17965 [Saprospiraceae bacterium]|nr:hypothetical protein [Saprospiraceae bacterium]